MSNVVQFPKRNIRQVPLEELKRLWDDYDDDAPTGDEEFSPESIHAELNRRGEGRYCAV